MTRKNKTSRALGLLTIFFAIITQATPAWSQYKLDPKGKLQLYGDFRLRQESDWASHTTDGRLRADRDRLRIRLRLGANWNPTSFLSSGLRVRSGSRFSQQSPHITFHDFSGNPTDDPDILLDKWFVQLKARDGSVWVGRNSPSFWKQNELFWDDDVTTGGIGASYRFGKGTSSVTINAGTSALPDGGIEFNGALHSGQVVHTGTAGTVGYTAAFGVFRLDGREGSKYLRQDNGKRDYLIWSGNAQAKLRLGGRTLTLGVDLMHNSEDYSGAKDPFTAANRDQKDGAVVSAHWGQANERTDWQIGYYFARIETLAVNASFAQDDWMRWGTAPQTDASDFKGQEFRFVYVPVNKMDVTARFYLVKAITSVQDGRRFRLDINYKF